MRKTRRRPPRLLRHLGGLLLGTVIVLLGLELLLRVSGAVLRAARPEPAPARHTVLCEGDSFVYGTGGRPFPEQLQEILDERTGPGVYRVVNEGFPGQNTAFLADLLEGHLEHFRPDVLIVLSGQNNFWQITRLRAGRRRLPLVMAAHRLLLHSRVYRFLRVMLFGLRNRTEYIGQEGPRGEVTMGGGRPAYKQPDLLIQAGSLSMKGEYGKAARLYKRAAELDPDRAAGYAGWGDCLLESGRFDEAVAVLEKGLKADRYGDTEELTLALGWAHYRGGRYDEALRVWEKGLERFPESARIRRARARIQEGRIHGPPDDAPSAEDLVGRSFREDIRRISALGKKYGAKTIFASYPEVAHPEVYETARELGERFIDFRGIFKRRFRDRSEYICEDGWHASTKGYRVMAEVFADEIERMTGSGG